MGGPSDGPSDGPGEAAGERVAASGSGTVGAGGTDGHPPGHTSGSGQVKHSSLVGFMSVPVSRRFPIRRSTLLMAVAFIGFGTLLYFNPPESTGVSTGEVVHTSSGDYLVPGAIKITSTTTTTSTPPTTTTLPVVASSTTSTSRPSAATTTRPAVASTTTTSTTFPSSTTTTRVVVGSSSPSTLSTSGNGSTTTAP